MRQASARDWERRCRTWLWGALPVMLWSLFLVATVGGSEPGGASDRRSETGSRPAELREVPVKRGPNRSESKAGDRNREVRSREGERPVDGAVDVELTSAWEEQPSGTKLETGDGDDPAGDWMSLVESVPVAPSLLAVLVLSVVPSLLLMTTCFVRFSIVLTLVRQALGTQQLPPNSVLMALALFLSCLVMEPVWRKAYQQGMRPYLRPEAGAVKPELEAATLATLKPLREFMSSQIELAGNSDSVWVVLESRTAEGGTLRERERNLTYDEIPLPTLAAAFVLSELKVGFVIGFQILLPFLVIDLIVGLVLSMLGLTAISHSSVSLPFKLLLFVLVDGWAVIVGRLLASVAG